MNQVSIIMLREWVKFELRLATRSENKDHYMWVIGNFVAFMNGLTNDQFMNELEFNTTAYQIYMEERKQQ